MMLKRFMVLMLGLVLGAPVSAEPLAKQLFGAKTSASRQSPAPYGGYSKGCAAGSVQLPETGPTWQAMRLSRNRNWGHPETIDFIQKLSAFAAKQPGWDGLYVGDISQPRGGPMTSGHRSHQIGLDVDIWMLPPSRLNLSRRQRENLSSIAVASNNGAYMTKNWSRAHHEIIRAAAMDKRVARIFVSPAIKVQMCKDNRGNSRWLRKIRPWWSHHYHFHVRLACPRGASGCIDQNPPPRGDGCADAQQWVNNILNPPPPKPRDPNAPKPAPRREYFLADLPQQCASVLRSN